MADDDVQRCPDGGRCHHACGDGPCFRVRCCGPLSGVYPGDRWPPEVAAAHGATLTGGGYKPFDPDQGKDYETKFGITPARRAVLDPTVAVFVAAADDLPRWCPERSRVLAVTATPYGLTIHVEDADTAARVAARVGAPPVEWERRGWPWWQPWRSGYRYTTYRRDGRTPGESVTVTAVTTPPERVHRAGWAPSGTPRVGRRWLRLGPWVIGDVAAWDRSDAP